MFKVGIVKQYFDKTGIALLELEGTLSVGDKIKLSFETLDLFSQKVEFMQVGYKKIESANRGDMILLKINEKVEVGTKIFKIS